MIIVVTGGSGSGKSAYAEETIASFEGENRYYIATMENRDEESRSRIARHRAMRRGKHFQTLECPRDIEEICLETCGDVLLECMSNLTANELFRGSTAADAKETARKICSGIRHLAGQCRNLVIVTNEVFSDGIQYDPWTKSYLECLGLVNQELSALANRVVEVVYTIPVFLKGK